VLAGAYRLPGQAFLLRAEANGLTGARLGLIAGRKVARRAVDRNRAKRLAREAFRVTRSRLPGVDVVLQLRGDLRKLGNRQVRSELDRLLSGLAARYDVSTSERALAK